MIDQIMEYNKKFVENKGYEPFLTSKYPDKKLAILTCMDTRLIELLPAALGIKNGDAKIIKNAGGTMVHPYGSVVRSLLVGILELGVEEVMVIGHTDCGVQGMDGKEMLELLEKRGIDKQHIDIVRHSAKPDPYDGDTNYPVSFAYTERDNSITYGKVKYDTYFSTTTNKMRTCAIILPPNYDKNKAYPVCYLLHGLGQDHTDWLNANADTIIGNMIAAKTAREMILVLPNCRARANDTYVADQFSLDNYRAFDNFINDLRDNLMPYIKENYSVAEGRENTAIAGFSMGGRTALYIGLSMQDTFGYIGGFCPAPGLFAYEMNGIAEDGLFKTDTFKLNDEYADNTLLMIVAAKNDTVVFDIPETYHNALVKNNTKHIWYKTTGGHDATVMDHGFYNFAKRLFNN